MAEDIKIKEDKVGNILDENNKNDVIDKEEPVDGDKEKPAESDISVLSKSINNLISSLNKSTSAIYENTSANKSTNQSILSQNSKLSQSTLNPQPIQPSQNSKLNQSVLNPNPTSQPNSSSPASKLILSQNNKLDQNDDNKSGLILSQNNKLDKFLEGESEENDKLSRIDNVLESMDSSEEQRDRNKQVSDKFGSPDKGSDKKDSDSEAKKTKFEPNDLFHEMYGRFLGPLSGVSTALWKAFSPGKLMTKAYDLLSDLMGGFGSKLKSFFVYIDETLLKGAGGKLIGMVSSFIEKIIPDFLKKIVGGFIDKLGFMLIPGIGQILDIAILLAPFWDYVRVFFYNWTKNNPFLHKLVTYLDHIITPLTDFFTDIVDFVKKLFTGGDWKSSLKNMGGDLLNIFKGLYAYPIAIVKGVIDTIKTMSFKDMLVSAIRGIISALVAIFHFDEKLYGGIWHALVSAFESIGPFLKNALNSSIKYLSDGLDSFFKFIGNAIAHPIDTYNEIKNGVTSTYSAIVAPSSTTPSLVDNIKKEADLANPDTLYTHRGEVAPAVTSTTATSVTSGKDTGLGFISSEYESGSQGYGAVSNGKGDAGGASYGKYQLASNTGTLNSFLKNSGYLKYFDGLTPGTPAFNAKWSELSKNKDFDSAQDQFIQNTHYSPAEAAIKSKIGLDVNARGRGLQELLYSTSVQFGPGGITKNDGAVGVFSKALSGKDVSKMSDSEVIQAVNAYKIANVETLFKSSSEGTRKAQAARFASEGSKELALAGVKGATISTTPSSGQPDIGDTPQATTSGTTGASFAQTSEPLGAFGEAKQVRFKEGSRSYLPNIKQISPVNYTAEQTKVQKDSNQKLDKIASNTSPTVGGESFNEEAFDLELIKLNMGLSG